jgi:hypothetical protein
MRKHKGLESNYTFIIGQILELTFMHSIFLEGAVGHSQFHSFRPVGFGLPFPLCIGVLFRAELQLRFGVLKSRCWWVP